MPVYVLDVNGQPLMPTHRSGKVRRLLKNNQAKVIKRCPFTIQLLYETTANTQPITLGIDAGSKVVGVSASTETEELYSAEVILRNDIVNLLSTRKEFRRVRRSRLRYRKPKFNNRVKNKRKGWLAPSVEQKISSHLKIIADVYKILPISELVIEVASFDVQKIKNHDISGKEYQEGDQLDCWNVREYVLWRDNHECQCCHGKSKDKRLNVHHIESRKTGGNAPNNLITLCKTCHDKYHDGEVKLNIKRGASFRDAAFMGIMRWAVYNRLKDIYLNVRLTYGYITKNARISNGLEKSHHTDALCIAGHPTATQLKHSFLKKKIRCHNRKIHKAIIQKGGLKKYNQLPYILNGFRNYDKVKYKGTEYFILSRRMTGYYKLGDIKGNVAYSSVSYKKLKFTETTKQYPTELIRWCDSMAE